MYLWNLDRLITHLKNNTLPSWQVSVFYVISPLLSICNALFFSSLLLSHHFIGNFFAHFLAKNDPNMGFYNIIALTASTLTLAITFIGMYLCYQTNKNGDNKDFRTRMACLSFPINFHLTVYVFALLGWVTIVGYLIIHGKIVLFKKQVTELSHSKGTIGQAVQAALNDKGMQALIPRAKKASSFLGAIFKAPKTLLNLPFIPGQINSFLKSLRATILMVYPVIAFLPPVLSLCHYLVVRKMLRRVSQNPS